MIKILVALSIVGLASAKDCAGVEDPADCGVSISEAMCTSSEPSARDFAVSHCKAMCGKCSLLQHPKMETNSGSLQITIPAKRHLVVSVEGQAPFNVDGIPQQLLDTQQSIADNIEPQIAEMQDKLDDMQVNLGDQLTELQEDLTPRFNSIAAQVQLNSLQSQCHEAPECDDDGKCTSAKKTDGTDCDDYNADTTDDACVGGTCTGTNLCDGVTCPDPEQCNTKNYCFRGKCLAGAPVEKDTACDFVYEDETEVKGKCNDVGRCIAPAPKVTKVEPKIIKIPGGGPVTVTGSNFRMGSLIEFNGVSMPTAWRGTETLVANHPASADTSGGYEHTLSVITPGEGKTSFDKAYTVKETLAPWNKDPWGNGKDGALQCNNLEGSYHDKAWAWKVRNAVKFESKQIVLGVAPGDRLQKDDKVLLIVTQDVNDQPDKDKRVAGLHQFLKVTGVSGTKVSVTSADGDGVTIFDPKKGHDEATWGKVRAVLQRVPQYTNVELEGCTLHPKSPYNAHVANEKAWTGIIAFSAKTTVKIAGNAAIDVTRFGLRGGKVPDRNRGEGGQSIRTAGYYPSDALNLAIKVDASQWVNYNGKSNQWGGEGGIACPLDLKYGSGGKGGCHYDVGCSTSTGGAGNHGGGGGGRDHGYQGGSGGAGSLCPGQYYTWTQSKRVDADGIVSNEAFERAVLGGGASAGGGGGRAVSSGGGGKAVGNGCYRSNKNHGGGDGGNGAPGGGMIYILAKDGLSGGGLLKAEGGKGGGGGGGELGSHKTSGGGGGAGGNGGSGGTIVVVTSPSKIAGSMEGLKVSVSGGVGGGGGGGGGVPNQHNPSASGAGGGGAKSNPGALGGGGGGGSPTAGGPYRGGNGAHWNGDIGINGGYTAGTDGLGGEGRGRYPGGGGGCSQPGGRGGEAWKGGSSAAKSSCNGENFGKDGEVDSGGAGGKGHQACGRDSNSGAGGGGGGRGATGFEGEVFYATSNK